jgi:hypothetical protein
MRTVVLMHQSMRAVRSMSNTRNPSEWERRARADFGDSRKRDHALTGSMAREDYCRKAHGWSVNCEISWYDKTITKRGHTSVGEPFDGVISTFE